MLGRPADVVDVVEKFGTLFDVCQLPGRRQHFRSQKVPGIIVFPPGGMYPDHWTVWWAKDPYPLASFEKADDAFQAAAKVEPFPK